MLSTRAIMDFIRDEYGKDYAPNTRETVRRFTLHQFVEAQLVVQNPDEPQRPVNSPKWNYQVTGEALEVLRAHGTDAWQCQGQNDAPDNSEARTSVDQRRFFDFCGQREDVSTH